MRLPLCRLPHGLAQRDRVTSAIAGSKVLRESPQFPVGAELGFEVRELAAGFAEPFVQLWVYGAVTQGRFGAREAGANGGFVVGRHLPIGHRRKSGGAQGLGGVVAVPSMVADQAAGGLGLRHYSRPALI